MWQIPMTKLAVFLLNEVATLSNRHTPWPGNLTSRDVSEENNLTNAHRFQYIGVQRCIV